MHAKHGHHVPAYPSPSRGASALVLRTGGESWLFDCEGEGTQTQFMRSSLKASKITKVFISHLHGDHLFGLPGLLCTISLNSNPQPDQPPPCVDIYGPRSSQLLFPYAVHELEPSDEQCPAEGHLSPALTASSDTLHPQERLWFVLYHRVPSFGFSVEERERPGWLNTDLHKALMPPGCHHPCSFCVFCQLP
uniref:ElaC ribonuclease Z 1 n=1 Tax=Sinocyclocheilus grahami TaxID=75366 RepID=A0A672KJ43_SINGR